jgi:hypothetical protein
MERGSLNAIIDYLGTEDPMGAAFDKFNRIGGGGTATIFDHPEFKDLIIRVTDYPDGWFGYAEGVMMDDEDQPYAPKMHDMIHIDGVWIATADRLIEYEETHQNEFLIGLLRKAIKPSQFGELEDEERHVIDSEMPDFLEFADMHLCRAQDLTDENFMHNGKTLIVNDPYRGMGFGLAEQLAKKYDISERKAAIIRENLVMADSFVFNF